MGIYPQPCAVNETESGGSKLVPIVSTFDYSIIDADTASLAKSAADRIRSRNAKMVESIIATGLDLIEIKKRLLEHGQFTKWLFGEFHWSDRTAQRYMSAAARFGSNPTLVSVLPLVAIYELAAKSTPESIRATVIDKLERGEHIDPRNVEAEIAATRQDRSEAKLPAKTRKARKRKREQDAAARVKREERQRAVELAADAKARELIDEFGAETVRRIREAVQDFDVGAALSRALGEVPS